MTWDIKPGDLVVCISDDYPEYAEPRPGDNWDWEELSDSEHVVVGQIYTVEAIGPAADPDYGSGIFLWLAEVPLAPDIYGYVHGHEIELFRPVSKTRSEEFRRLVAPIPERELVGVP